MVWSDGLQSQRAKNQIQTRAIARLLVMSALFFIFQSIMLYFPLKQRISKIVGVVGHVFRSSFFER